MKKITLLIILTCMSLGYSQTNLEDFEGTPNLSGFEGLGGANIVANPSIDGNNSSATVGELIVVEAGNPWQGANLIMQSNYIDVSDPVTNTVDIQVYSTTAFNMLARLADGQAGAVDSAADQSHAGTGWETLTFTFNENLDGTGSANGEYGTLALFPNWASPGWNDPEIEITVYIDNITGVAGSTVVPPVPDPPAAPIPSTPDGEVYNIYNDTNGYTTNFPFVYTFGSLSGEPNLDTSGGSNLALKFDFSVTGYGVGEGGPDDVSAYDFVSFDYYAQAGSTGFRFVMISNDGGVSEYNYEIGTNEAIVTEAWTKVSIPMSYFTNLGFSATNLFQWKMDPFMQDVNQGSIVYVDNILLTQNDPLSIGNYDIANFNAFPNPTNNEWKISGNIEMEQIAIYDILGKRVMRVTPNAKSANINASSLITGVYFAKITGFNGTQTLKLIKQ